MLELTTSFCGIIVCNLGEVERERVAEVLGDVRDGLGGRTTFEKLCPPNRLDELNLLSPYGISISPIRLIDPV